MPGSYANSKLCRLKYGVDTTATSVEIQIKTFVNTATFESFDVYVQFSNTSHELVLMFCI